MIRHIAWYYMVLHGTKCRVFSCIDTIDVILFDWYISRVGLEQKAAMSENCKQFQNQQK